MAFKNISKFGINKGDLQMWAKSGPTNAFKAEIEEQKRVVHGKLLKDGAQKHDENAESYKAFNKVLRLIEEASK